MTESISKNQYQSISRIMSTEETPSWFYNSLMYKKSLKTFAGAWKLQFITPQQMARAGLFFTGVQDRVRCIYCSKVFDNWKLGDDPFLEHKRQSPSCLIFNESLGK